MMRARSHRSSRGVAAHRAGHIYETLACLLLMIKGYHILQTRLRTPAGEIDILATRGNTLVIVEVKKRKTDEAAGTAISFAQAQRLRAAAQHILAQYGADKAVRFDAILFGRGHIPQHIKNAF